jgi:uncharacterized protein
MNRRYVFGGSFLLLIISVSTRAQDVRVSRENKTVAVTVTKSVEVQPELGIVYVGYHNDGRTKDSVYDENSREAQKILEALLAAGVKKADIQTESLDLSRVDDSWREQKQNKEVQYKAAQTWKIRVPIGEVQKVVDLAVEAGANHVSDVVWAVKDPDALDTQARAAAVANARQLAEQMAQTLGGKVGGLLYVSNGEPPRAGGNAWNGNLQTVEVSSAKVPVLNLFPQKVSREVTIYAVFALE